MKGVIGVYSRDDAATKSLYNLYGVQHRGQEGAGIVVSGDYKLRGFRGRGLVSNVFDDSFKSFVHLADYIAVGAVSGENCEHNITIPPLEFESETEEYQIALAMDGSICDSAAQEPLFGYVLGRHLAENSIDKALAETMKELDYGYYSLVMAVFNKEEGYSELYAARDMRGIRPLYFSRNGNEVFITSESPPIDVLESMGMDIKERGDVTPGSLIKIDRDGFIKKEQVMEPKPAHCTFEWVYFGRPDSVIEGKTVHNVRKRLGHELVRTHSMQPEPDITIIPTPDSGRSVCIGVGEALGIVPDEGVIKNSYLGRTYIIDDPEFRKTASDLKHNIIKESVRGKKVLITDDSIVRGTVSESLAKTLLKAGAGWVEFLVSYAPIYYPCMSDPKDKPLAAKEYEGKSITEIGDLVASNLPSIGKVRFNTVPSVVKAIELPEDNLCMLCITGNNPLGEDERTIKSYMKRFVGEMKKTPDTSGINSSKDNA
jgi:amidophosphoribosyltransferase